MKRKKPKTPGDSPALKQLANLIDARLPCGHGFALLTFPLGAAVDPRVRYVGKGHREDILGTMEQWVAHQRGHGWGHDPSGVATQWTTRQPTTEGIYLLKVHEQEEAEYVRLKLAKVADEFQEELRIDNWDGKKFVVEAGGWVEDTCPKKVIWLGPIPEPWLAPDQQSQLPRDPFAGDEVARHKAISEHHAERFENLCESFYAELQARSTTPDEPLPDAVKAMLQDALGEGFTRGIVAQQVNPFPHMP